MVAINRSDIVHADMYLDEYSGVNSGRERGRGEKVGEVGEATGMIVVTRILLSERTSDSEPKAWSHLLIDAVASGATR